MVGKANKKACKGLRTSFMDGKIAAATYKSLYMDICPGKWASEENRAARQRYCEQLGVEVDSDDEHAAPPPPPPPPSHFEEPKIDRVESTPSPAIPLPPVNAATANDFAHIHGQDTSGSAVMMTPEIQSDDSTLEARPDLAIRIPMSEKRRGHLLLCCVGCSKCIMVQFSSGDLPKPIGKYLGDSSNGIAMTYCRKCDKQCDALPHEGLSAWGLSHAPHAASFRSWNVHTNIMEGTKVSRAAKTIVGQQVPFLQAHDQIMLADRTYVFGLVGETDRITTVKLLETDVDEKGETWCSYMLGGFL